MHFDQISEEHVLPVCVIGVGSILAVSMGMNLVLIGGLPFTGLLVLETLLFIVGLAITIGGIVWWGRLSHQGRFYGVKRSWLPLVISYLDIKECSIENVGIILFPQPPREYVDIERTASSVARKALEKLQSRLSVVAVPFTSKSGLKSEMDSYRIQIIVYPLIMVSMVPLIVMMMSFPFSGGIFTFPNILLVFLIICMGMSSIYAFLKYRKLKQLEEVPPPSDVPEQVSHLLSILRHEYKYPFRTLVVRNHSELAYTGKVFNTSTGVKLHEADFIPSPSS